MAFASYPAAIEFLHGLQLFGASFGLGNVRRLASLAGNPQDRLRFIHVAGTNGKGSVCAMLESVYRAAGLRTGLFTSPHLVHFGERIQVNGRRLGDEEVIRLTGQLKDLLAAGAQRGWWREGTVAVTASEEIGAYTGDSVTRAAGSAHLAHPTFFEVVTVMALRHFADADCEVVLWETGLGGRLDATNIVTPLAGVITNVSVEHAQQLGDTVIKIAAEKSGIVKPRVPAVVGAMDAAALRVIREVAASRGAPLRVAHDDQAGHDLATEKPLFRGYQRWNARLARAVIDELQPVLPVSAAAIEAGLRNFHWPGRLQEVECRGTRFLIDGAHNPAGVRALRETLEAQDGWRPVPVVFGTFADKDVPAVLREVMPLAAKLLLVPIDSPRSARPAQLADQAARLAPGLPVQVCVALAEALGGVSGEERVLVTGSLFLVGAALEQLAGTSATVSERSLNDWKPCP